MLRRLLLRALCTVAGCCAPLTLEAAVKTWTAAVSGDFGAAANWTGGVPGSADSATFNAAGNYTVTFDNSPNPLANPVLNQDLNFSAGGVTFTSGSGGPYTYQLTGAGGDDANITGGTLTLGTLGNPLHMTVDDDLVLRGSTLNVFLGSHVNTADLFLAQATANGTIVVDGNGSQLNVTNVSTVGANGVVGSLTYRNSATGALGTVVLANSANAASAGTLNVDSGAAVTSGNLSVGPSATVAATGTVNVSSVGSTLTLTGSSTLTVGGAVGIGNVNIGTTANSGTFTSGTGAITINSGGTVTIGAGANDGVFNAKGDVTINGGVLTRASGSAFNLDPARTMTVQNGGRASISGGYVMPANATYNVDGVGSTMEALSGGGFVIVNGSQMNVTAGATVSASGFMDIGTTGNGTLTVDGTGSSVTLGSTSLSHWGQNGNTATISFSNDATFNGGSINMADTFGVMNNSHVEVLSGSDFNVGSLRMLFGDGDSGALTFDVQGSGSTVTQAGSSTLDLGNGTTGTATLNVSTTASGATFTSGTGSISIDKTGTVNVGSGANSGTFNANGNVTIGGGLLTRSAGSTFSLAAGKSMSISGGGAASFTGSYTTAADAIYLISGATSKLETISSGSLLINNGAQVSVTFGGRISSTSSLNIGTTGDGSLTVDGTGSTAISTGLSTNSWGSGGNTATVIFRNNATGSFAGQVSLAGSSTSDTTANVTVESGADLTTGALSVGLSGVVTSSAILTINGPGSTVTLNPAANLTIGNSLSGTANIRVQDGASLTVGTGGGTVLNASGTLNIDDGIVDLKTLTDNGGRINFNSGTLGFLGNLTVGASGVLGNNLTLGTQHRLTLSGTTTVEAAHALTLEGGLLSTAALVANGTFAFHSGTLSITGASGLTVGAGGPLGSALTLSAGQTLNVTNTATINAGALLVLESGGAFSAGTLTSNGTVALDGIAAVLGGNTVSNSGLVRGEGTIAANVTNAAAGEIRAQNGKTLALAGLNGANAGTVNLQGGTLEFTQALTNSSTGQIIGRGTIAFGGAGLANQGHVALSSGITDVFGDVSNNTGVNTRGISISGNADVTFWDDVTNVGVSLFRVSAGSSATFFGTFAPQGSITGGGNVYIEADITPGASPASVSFGGNLFVGSAAQVDIELAGTTVGSQFDHLEVAGAAGLGGTLDVTLLGGFQPNAGDTFQIVDAAGGVNGTFASMDLPDLRGGLHFNVEYAAQTVTLRTVGVLGDYNRNGTVDAADYTVWRNALNQPAAGLAADGNGDHLITRLDFDVWKAHFGEMAGGGSAISADVAVPEPAALVLLAWGMVILFAARRTSV